MSTETMTSKERVLAAMRGEIPDRVPVQIGISQMMPAKRTGLPWWDIYLYGKAEIWHYVLELTRLFGCDGKIYGTTKTVRSPRDQRTYDYAIVRQDKEFIVRRTTIHTPDGDLWEETAYPVDNTPAITCGLIKDRHDFEVYLKYFFPEDVAYDFSAVREAMDALGQDGVVNGAVGLPGMHHLTDLFDGRLEKATYFAVDHPDLLEEYRQKMDRQILHQLEQTIDFRPDYIQIGASGLLTLSTPRWVRKLSLPTLQKITRMCKEAGVLTELHACGKARLLVEMCANETDLDSINPLQPAPMGDVDLGEVKAKFGKRITLKGNVGVTEPMLFGTPADVEKDVIRCMDAAKAGGRFILFNEEQLGRDTPYENVHAMVEAAKHYGKY